MKSYKDGKYIIIDLETDKNNIIKYDLSICKPIGKKGKPVKTLSGYLSSINIEDFIETFPDEKYRDFLKLVKRNINSDITNIGTFLNQIKDYSLLEQYTIIGIKVSRGLRTHISNCPKGLIKLARQFDFEITDGIIEIYKQEPDIITNICSKKYEMFCGYDIIKGSYVGTRYNCELKQHEKHIYKSDYYNKVMTLVNQYHYNLHSLMDYIDRILMYEGEDNYRHVITILYDYVTMISSINAKYEKYPKCLVTCHNIAVRIYKNYKKEYEESLFEKRIKHNFEFQYKNYIFIYPKTTYDIKDEGIQMNHCVASYIDRVIDGQTDIVFMREKDNSEVSLITIQITNFEIVQIQNKYKSQCNFNKDENIAIEKYKEHLKSLINH